MNRNRFSFLVACAALLVLVAASCGNRSKTRSDTFILHGKLKNTNGEKIVLVQMKADSLKPLDSMKIDDNGEFRFRYKPKDICFYMLKMSNDNFITLLLDKGETVEISGNSRQLANEYRVSGSQGSELLHELTQFTRSNYKTADSLFQIQVQHQDSVIYKKIKKENDSLYQILYEKQQGFVRGFITKNPTSLASLFALYQIFGRQKVLNERDDFSYYAMLDSSLMVQYPKNDFVAELHIRVSDIKTFKNELQAAKAKLDTGMMAPDISLKNVGGFSQPLSSLKGRVTLLLFWAASSQPSIKVLDQMKWIQKKYGPKGFTVYAVSLDKYRQQWEEAIRKYRLTWINVSDLLEWESPVVKLYALETIPHALLIDRDGRIIKRGITMEELSTRLYKMYKF